jgi:hypothetical protein
MRCPEVRDLLHAFLDGELDVDKNVGMLKHLELCPPCRERSEVEGELRGVIARACCEPLTQEQRCCLIDKACCDEVVTPPARRGRRIAIAAAAAALLVGGFAAMHIDCLLGCKKTPRLVAEARQTVLLQPPLAPDHPELVACMGDSCPAPTGLTFVGGNFMTVGGRREPVLRYRCDCDGKEVAMVRLPDAHVHRWQTEELGDRNRYLVFDQADGAPTVGWAADDGSVWCLIGCCTSMPRERLYVLAASMRRGL